MKTPGFTAQLTLDNAITTRQRMPYMPNEAAAVIPQYMEPRPVVLAPGRRGGGYGDPDTVGCVMNCMATYGLQYFDACSAACAR